MRVLVDAHAVLWAAVDDERLPGSVRELLADTKTRLVLSVATIWELTLKSMADRLRLPEPPEQYFEGLIRDFGYEVLPIHQRHVLALPELPTVHGDPFDRILVAQAVVEEIAVVTGDPHLREYPIHTLW
ncbi:MAG: type II toxin-antitoxin system VapC family toxin [Actinomycetota bacterium]